MKTLLSLLIWLGIITLTGFKFLADLFLTLVIFPFDEKRKTLHTQSYWWANAIIGLNPYWDVSISGLNNIDPGKTYVIVANHQSLADIIIMYKIRRQFRWVAKDSLFRIPLIGWCLALGKHIRLARGKYSSIKQTYLRAAAWLREDISVAFFPEGTRSSTQTMNQFQNGAFKLAIQEKKAILPIAINGTREAIPKGSWIFKTKVNGHLKVLPPIETQDLSTADFIELKNTVYAALSHSCQREPNIL